MTGMWRYVFLLTTAALTTAQLSRGSCKQGDNSPTCLPVQQSLSSAIQSSLSGIFLEISSEATSSHRKSPTVKLDTIELAEYNGYGAERHLVTTEDGYILEVHRIYSKQDSGSSKPVVLVHHGLLMTSRDFLVLGPGKALGYLLADANYDVWLCNARGNTYSRKHISLSPDSKEFWDFSYTEHAMYDVPAVIDYALQTTGRSKVHYIGHSVGTLIFLILGSKRPEFLSKIQSYTALAPLTTTTKARSAIIQTGSKNYQLLSAPFEALGIYEVLPERSSEDSKSSSCNENHLSRVICTSSIFAMNGYNPQFDSSILDEILEHSPSGSSLKEFRHFGQNYYNGFREYDYGARENLKRYNNAQPPIFDYSKINVPSQLYYAAADLLADYTGAVEICRVLPNVHTCEEVQDKNFNHNDFIWARDAPTGVYKKLLDGLQRFEKNVTQ